MKSFVVICLLALSYPALAADTGSLFDKYTDCVFFANKATQFTIAASVDSESQYIDYMNKQLQVARPEEQEQLVNIGHLAWQNRNAKDPTSVGMAMFASCLHFIGMSM